MLSKFFPARVPLCLSLHGLPSSKVGFSQGAWALDHKASPIPRITGEKAGVRRV